MSEIKSTDKNIVIEGKSAGGDNSRSRTAFLIALTIIPIILLATIRNYLGSDGFLSGLFGFYNIAFQIVVILGLLYTLHELINFVSPKKEMKREYIILMISFSIIAGLPLALNAWNDLLTLNLLRSLDFLKIQFDTTIFMLILLVVALGVITALNVGLRELLIVAFTSLMLFGFFSTLINFTIDGGWETIFMYIIIVVVSDTTAYYGGKKMGTKKIFPEVSPSKTVEGFITGVVSAIVVGFAIFLVIFLGFGSIDGVLAGNIIPDSADKFYTFLVIIGVALIAPFGDVYFSKIKRTYNKKDFSNLLPGHGGILDRIDSHIFALTTAGLLTMLFI